MRRVVIASGGTGGHMFPALALGRELGARGWSILYAVDRRGLRYLEPGAAYRLILAASPAGGLLGRLNGYARLGLGMAQALALLIARRPQAVAAFGGYASVPTGAAAGLLRLPLVLHEQNAVLGRAHRLLLRFATALALSLEDTSGRAGLSLPTRLTGNPVRPGFAPRARAGDEAETSEGPLRLFVMGGSQGARIFSDLLPDAFAALPAELRGRLRLAQQCRPEDLERVRAAYAGLGMEVELASFFEDIPERLASADLVISRAGASSLSEILASGTPAVLVPYPHAADDHQRANARALADAGAARLLEPEGLGAAAVAEALGPLLAEPEERARMARAAAGLAVPDAAKRLADLVEEVSA